jgi:hypothetical protein
LSFGGGEPTEVSVLVRDGDDYLELAVAERGATVHDAGDTRFAVRVRVSGLHTALSAESLCWVELRVLAAFAEALRALEERRQGSAALESMSPGELQLEVRSTDRAGHMAAVGQVGWWLSVGSGEPYWSAVAFRVPFCPSELPALVREFSALAVAPDAEPGAAPDPAGL